MSSAPDVRKRRWHLPVLALLAVLAIALIAGAVIVRALLQPQRFTALLQGQLADAGLVLSVDKPAAPALWPHPAVQLQGFRLSNAGSATPLLTASEARIVVPWRALLQRQPEIERFEIEAPRIDLDQLQALLARLPRAAGPPQLPHIGAGVRIDNGVLLRGDVPLLLDIDAETGPLLPETPFRLDASVRDAGDRSAALSLRFVPSAAEDAVHFGHVGIGVNVARGPHVRLGGEVTWHGGADVGANLRGILTTSVPEPAAHAIDSGAPASGTTPSASPIPSTRTYTLALDVFPAAGRNPLNAIIKLDGADTHVAANVPPFALIDWWNRLLTLAPNAAMPLPPLDGKAQMAAFDYGPLHARHVLIESGPDVAPLQPAPSSSAGNGADGKRAGAGH